MRGHGLEQMVACWPRATDRRSGWYLFTHVDQFPRAVWMQSLCLKSSFIYLDLISVYGGGGSSNGAAEDVPILGAVFAIWPEEDLT